MDNFSTLVSSLASTNLTWSTIVSSLILSFILGVSIAYVYKKTNRGYSFEAGFAFTLVLITIIINVVMIAIGSSVALSLGLIGSLSIIRFRTAIKSTLDMAFIFWAIAVGLGVGAHQNSLAIATVVVLGAVCLILKRSRLFFPANTDYIVIVRLDKGRPPKDLSALFDKYQLSWKLKSSFSDASGGEFTYSIFAHRKLNMEELTTSLNDLAGVKNISVLSPDTNLYI